MGIFYTQKPAAQITTATLETALRLDPTLINVPEEARRRTEALATELKQKALSGQRLGVAIALLGGLLLAAIYTGQQGEGLRDLHGVLNQTFEILVGGISGLLTGEAMGSENAKP